MEIIEIDLRLKGGSVYATFEISGPCITLSDVEKLLTGFSSIWDFESFSKEDVDA